MIVGVGRRVRCEMSQCHGPGNECTQQREVVFDAELCSSLWCAIGVEVGSYSSAIEPTIVGKADESNGRRCEAVAREHGVAVRVYEKERTDDTLKRRHIQLVQRQPLTKQPAS